MNSLFPESSGGADPEKLAVALVNSQVTKVNRRVCRRRILKYGKAVSKKMEEDKEAEDDPLGRGRGPIRCNFFSRTQPPPYHPTVHNLLAEG